jgi:hypothetical protein
VSEVEASYERFWREAGGLARVQRTASLYASFREMLEFDVRRKNPSFNDREVVLGAARRMYQSDSAVQKLLDEMESAPCTTRSSGVESKISAPSSTN